MGKAQMQTSTYILFVDTDSSLELNFDYLICLFVISHEAGVLFKIENVEAMFDKFRFSSDVRVRLVHRFPLLK